MKMLIALVMIFSFSLAHADISLSDLGMEKEATVQVDPKLEEVMRERRSMLSTHQVLGLTTWGLMTATLLMGNQAIDNNNHMYLGMATGATYLATAYYSLTAPKPKDIKDKWRMKWHKGLAWVHFPLMLLVPYLGYQHKRHEENGQKISSLEKQHATLAGILYGSFTISAALMTIEF